MKKFSVSGRRKARGLALQALYQWQMSKEAPLEIQLQFQRFNDMAQVDEEYFCELLHQIPLQLEEIEENFSPFLDRTLQELNPVELAVLRIATYELVKRLDIPYRVVINEALELAKRFGSEDGHKYVNGVLDQVAKKVRSLESAS